MITTSTCSIDGCEKSHEARGWCKMHYNRWWRHGDPHHVEQIRGDNQARFWSHVDKFGPDGFHFKTGENLGPCWLWTAADNNNGYGVFWNGERQTYAHIFAYVLLVGPIPENLEPDHLCRVRSCVRPFHLEPVTHLENVRRGKAGAWQAAKTHCPSGHEYSTENTYICRQGGRACRTCNRERWE